MLAPCIVALLYHEQDIFSFLYSSAITLSAGACLIIIFPPSKKEMSHREGFLIVSLGWIFATLFGSLPFLFDQTFPSFSDAYFETVSGFTTTGATVLSNIEIMPRCIIFWRSMIQWLGGMGIILFSIAILPLLGIGGMQLYKAEVPGPVIEKLKPRIAETARSLWKIYLALSLLEVFFLILAGMSLFDAICHAFTTLATGGFSTRNKSIEAFQNPYVDFICIAFMFAAGANFALHYRAFSGNVKSFWKDKEFLVYCTFLFTAIMLLTLVLRFQVYEDNFSSFRRASFQAVSLMTTTGYSTANFEMWPFFGKFVLLLLMFIGGSAGSTGGGIKCIRILLIIRMGYRELFSLVHPHAVVPVKIGGKTIPDGVLRSVTAFVILYVLIFVVGSLAMSLIGLDFVTAVSAVAASLGNVGPGLGGVGPYENYLSLSAIGKWILMLLMLLGRLEIFTLLIIFTPEFWKK
jgi:trk system potassium uptake protein TrkH